MNEKQLKLWIEGEYSGLDLIQTYGESSFFYNPEKKLPKGVYFFTIKSSNGPNDKASSLDREGVYRVNFGIGKKKFIELFGEVPKRPEKGGVVDMDIDFEELNTLMPHPIYSWISWVCILSPTEEKIADIKFLLDFAYQKVVKSYNQKMKKKAAANKG